MVRVTVWGENVHERNEPEVRAIYPDGMHAAIAAGLSNLLGDQVRVRTATLEQPEHGLTDEVLAETDVLTWWGHKAHREVSDEIVDRVQARILSGMGLIVLHSGHHSKIFKRMMGTTCDLKWREADENERLWVVAPDHPIVAGIDQHIDLEQEEMYGEFFDIPEPDTLVFVSWFPGGEVFRSGCCYSRGRGRIFYFRPGHESYPTYYQPQIQTVIANAVRWAAPSGGPVPVFGNAQPLERIGVPSGA